jgi:hypothetical protein
LYLFCLGHPQEKDAELEVKPCLPLSDFAGHVGAIT